MSPLRDRERGGGEKWGKERVMEMHTQTRETEGNAGREPGGVLDDWSRESPREGRVEEGGGWKRKAER